MTDAPEDGEPEYCQADDCPMETTPLTPKNSMTVHPRDHTPDESGWISRMPMFDQERRIHEACYNPTLHSPA